MSSPSNLENSFLEESNDMLSPKPRKRRSVSLFENPVSLYVPENAFKPSLDDSIVSANPKGKTSHHKFSKHIPALSLFKSLSSDDSSKKSSPRASPKISPGVSPKASPKISPGTAKKLLSFKTDRQLGSLERNDSLINGKMGRANSFPPFDHSVSDTVVNNETYTNTINSYRKSSSLGDLPIEQPLKKSPKRFSTKNFFGRNSGSIDKKDNHSSQDNIQPEYLDSLSSSEQDDRIIQYIDKDDRVYKLELLPVSHRSKVQIKCINPPCIPFSGFNSNSIFTPLNIVPLFGHRGKHIYGKTITLYPYYGDDEYHIIFCIEPAVLLAQNPRSTHSFVDKSTLSCIESMVDPKNTPDEYNCKRVIGGHSIIRTLTQQQMFIEKKLLFDGKRFCSPEIFNNMDYDSDSDSISNSNVNTYSLLSHGWDDKNKLFPLYVACTTQMHTMSEFINMCPFILGYFFYLVDKIIPQQKN